MLHNITYDKDEMMTTNVVGLETPAVTLRPATLADLERLLEMGRRFIAESTYAEFIEANDEAIRNLLARLISSPDSGILVALKGERLVGMLGLLVFPHFISGELIAGEVFWWVNPEEREGGAGLRLLHEAEKVAVAVGAKKLQMIAPNERVERLYERLGFKKVETTYQKGL